MIFYRISIFIVLMGLTIFDVNIQEVIGDNQRDPYKIEGKWFVVATSADDSAIFSKLKCWSVTITVKSRTKFHGISSHLDESDNRVSTDFDAVRSELYLYPNVFNIFVSDSTHAEKVMKYEVELYENYIQQFSTWVLQTEGEKSKSLIVSRHAGLSKEQEGMLNGLPHFTKIVNELSDSCSIAENELGSSTATSSDDPYRLNGKWYVGAYNTSDTSLPSPRCWTVNISTSSSSSYTGTSSYSVDGNDYEIVGFFSATPFKNRVKVAAFKVSSTDAAKKFEGLDIVTYETHIYNYSFWVPVTKTFFEYLVVSRYPIFSEVERYALSNTGDGLFFINNTNNGRCPSYKLEATDSTKDSDDDDFVDDDEATKMPMHNIVKPSLAHRVSITIPVFLLFFIHLCLY